MTDDEKDRLQAALAAYREGAWDLALTRLLQGRHRDDIQNPLHLALLANLHAKLKQPHLAASAFLALGHHTLDPKERAGSLKTAALLYLQLSDQNALADMAVACIAANPQDLTLAFRILRMVHQAGRKAIVLAGFAEIDPASADYHRRTGNFFDRIGEPESAYRIFQDGVNAHPQDSRLRARLIAQARKVADFPVLRQFDLAMQDLQIPANQALFAAEQALQRLYWCENEARLAAPALDTPQGTDTAQRSARRAPRPAGEKQRIGYVSADFGNHVMLSVMAEIFRNHDRQRFDFRLYCHTPPELRKVQQSWPPALKDRLCHIDRMSDAEAAARISADGIDLLVDLKGHTAEARLGIFALTDAPVTATYLGYPGTVTGVDIDYLISDPIVTPTTSFPHYHQKICRLPDVQMPNPALSFYPDATTSRADWSLPDDRIVLSAFNALYKITPRTIDLWSRILKQAPESILWLRCAEPEAQRRCLDEFRRQDIAEDRIIFFTAKLGMADYLATLGLADLALDTLPYNGHSTTADLLRAGVPVVTAQGQAYQARVSQSLLHSVWLDELVAPDDEAYVALAIRLASDHGYRENIRNRLATARETSPLFDPVRMTRNLERAYLSMLDRARSGLPPDHFDLT